MDYSTLTKLAGLRRVFANVGLLFKRARIEAGVPQGVAAQHLGYQNAKWISNLERGRCLLPLIEMKKLAEMYRMSHIK